MMDLTLVSLDDLIAEIDKRFDVVCILLTKSVSKDEEDRFFTHMQDKRCLGAMGCLGAMDVAHEYLSKSYNLNDIDTFVGGV